MSPFPSFSLIGQPDYAAALRQLTPKAVAGVDTLIIYDADYDFLARVLGAAGYDDPKLQLHLLEWSPQRGGIDLAGLLRHLAIRRVMLFGQDAASFGLHFHVADYFPVAVAGVTYLKAPSAAVISQAKAKGDNGPAGGLWRGVKAAFMKEV
jgi:hypothetical protein